LFGVYVHFPFNAWRDGHNHHHKHFGNLDRFDASQTILFTKKQYEAMSKPKKILVRIFREPIVFFLFSAPYVWFVALFYTVAKRYGILSLTFLEKVMSVVLYTWIFPIFGISAWKMWISVILTDVIGTILFHLQHSVNSPYRQRKTDWDYVHAAVEGSTYLAIPSFLRPFTDGIEFHHIHHLNTNVASYSLSDCHEKYDSLSKDNRNWDKFHINRVGLKLALKSMMNVMYD
jgi:omega-6 fatty acid desaturase (delta-12 desaturase)